MNKSFHHMEALLRFCCIAILIFISHGLQAQEVRDTIKLLDTLIDAPPTEMTNDDTVIHFDKVVVAPKVHLRHVPDSLVEAMKNSDDFWYANVVPVKKKAPEAKTQQPSGLPFYRQPWFKTFLWIIIIGALVAVVIWYLAASNVLLFRKAPAGIMNANNAEDHNDIFSINYDSEISKALSTKNYRLSIRLLYLQTLKMMTEKGIIQYKAEKTNSDYLWQLQGTTYYNEFFHLTRDFDYTWYGKFEVSEAAFQSIQKDFTTFKNRL